MTGDADNMYVAVPGSYCDLAFFKDLGIDFVEGRKSDEWGFWEFLSWENADKYHADLILVDNRANAMERYSYAGYAPVLEQLAAAVQKSRRLTTP